MGAEKEISLLATPIRIASNLEDVADDAVWQFKTTKSEWQWILRQILIAVEVYIFKYK